MIEELLRPVGRRPAGQGPAAGDARKGRQPLHLMAGGAQRFKAGISRKMGQIALASMDEYAPHFVAFAKAMGLPQSGSLPEEAGALDDLRGRLEVGDSRRSGNNPAWLAYSVYRQVRAKLESEPVECYCIDFEDGYGLHPDDVEDADAARVALEISEGMASGDLPARLGIRIKPLTPETGRRAARTLDIVISTLLTQKGQRLPPSFFVLLAKASSEEQSATLARLLTALEEEYGLSDKAIAVDLLVETPEAMVQTGGRWGVGRLVDACQGRCHTIHFGLYDYTSALGITAAQQRADHPIGDIARHLLQLSVSGRGIYFSDGPIMALPIAPHRPRLGTPLTEEERTANREAVHGAWRVCYEGVWHALGHGYYQGWDLHPNQLPARYAANFTFFRQELAANSQRLRNFVKASTGATRLGTVFDDPATVRALINYFRRAYGSGAITEAELEATGLNAEEIYRPTFEEIFGVRDGS